MLEMKVFREDSKAVFENLKRRKMPDDIAKGVIQMDQEWRELIDEGNKLRSQRNRISREIGELKKKGKDGSDLLGEMAKIKKGLMGNESKTKETLASREEARMRVPNLLDSEVPQGQSEHDNRELSLHGKKKKTKTSRPHQEVMELVGGVDLKRAANVTGRRFYFLTGDLARLEMALINYAIDVLCERGYSLTIPPFMMNKEAYEGVVDLNDFEEVMYKIEDHDLYLIATSEHPMTSRFKNEIIEIKDKPLRYAGISTNFRREVGAHGMSDRGIWRVHQFAKVEQVIICKPEDSKKFHDELVANAIHIFKGLEIPFRVVGICTGDIGTVAARKFDLEAWMPSSQQWKEVVSASNCRS